MGMNIKGCLENHRKKSMKGLFTHDDGTSCTDQEARDYLYECLGKGWKVIPLTDECEGFDYFGNGCPKHEIKEKND